VKKIVLEYTAAHRMLLQTQGSFGKFPHGKRDGFPTMNIHTLEELPPFEGDSYIFPTHKRGLSQEEML
jgi:hypothetical protein